MAHTPLVSVLTPSFDQAAWLPDNLRSVASQTYPRIEHVVMDGGSTDGSVEILRAAGPGVRWRSERDRGQAHAVNKAFEASSGEIVGWLNSDDALFTPGAVSAVVRRFLSDPRIDVVYGHAAFVNADGVILQMMWVPPFSGGLYRFFPFLRQPATFFRRSALGDRLLDETFHFAMDRELFLRLLSEGRRFERVDEVLAVDRHQAQRKSLTRLDVLADERRRLAERYAVPRRPWHVPARLALTLATRAAGIRLVPRARGRLAFDGIAEPPRRIALRQFGRRTGLPTGAGPGRPGAG